jgi:hypothetical protein
MLGLLQIGVSQVCPGPHPLLTAGWVLNSILHTVSVLLFYRVGKHLLGHNAFYFAVLAGINPWMLQMLPDPIAETAIIFMTLLTFDFLLRRSKWCYLFAMMASMTRYELTALIAIAFFVDMVLGKTLKERIRAFLFAALASVPMILWIVLWRVYRPDSQHYTGHFIDTQTRSGLGYWRLLWQTTFGPLLQAPSWVGAVFGKLKVTSQPQADAIQQAVRNLEGLMWVVGGAGYMFALIYSAMRKNWKFWALFAFWAIYVGAHTMKHKTLDRYTIPVIWLTLLIAFYGLQSLVLVIREKWSGWRLVSIPLQLVIFIMAVVWLVRLTPVLGATVSTSTDSASLVYVSIAVVAVFLGGRAWIHRQTSPAALLSVTVPLAVCGLLLVSNQFQVVRMLGNGGKDAEFKMLADWFRENAQPGEKMATTMYSTVKLFVPARGQDVLHTGGGSATTFPAFIEECERRNITYVAWDSRIGLTPQDSYYKAWNIQKTAPLSQPRDIGPFKFIKTIQHSSRRYIHIFKFQPLLHPPSVEKQPKPAGQTPGS